MVSYSQSEIENIIGNRFEKETWYDEVLSYLLQRYSSIESRMLSTFRYVDCHPDNRHVFSYEYASILRDSGSVFGSTMDRLVSKTGGVSTQLDMGNYRQWLVQIAPNIHRTGAEIDLPLERKLLFPFLQLKDANSRLEWWRAYNNVKHSDIDRFQDGNLENALNAVAALAILLSLVRRECRVKSVTLLFPIIGLYDPEEVIGELMLFSATATS